MSKHDDDRVTSDDLLMNQESFEQMLRDTMEDSHDDEGSDDSKERFVSFAQQRRADRLRNWKKESERDE